MNLTSFASMALLAVGVTAIAVPPNHNVTNTVSHASHKHNSTEPTKTAAATCISGILNRASPWAKLSTMTAPCSQLSTLCADENFICLLPGQKLALRTEPTPPSPPSPPLRPTTDLVTTITSDLVAPAAPLRPISNNIVTVTTIAPAKRADEKDAWYLECVGNDKVWAYGNVCPNPDFILIVNKQECDQWCSCDNKGNMKCASPVAGCEDKGQVTTMCAKGSTEFSCQCKKLNTAQKNQAVVTKRAEAAGAMTTMYGLLYDHSTPTYLAALYLPQSYAQFGSDAFKSFSYQVVKPTTLVVGSKYPGTSLTGPTTQDQPFPAEQTTTIYGAIYDTKASNMQIPVYVVAQMDKDWVEDVYSQFNVIELEPQTIYSSEAIAQKLAKITERAAEAPATKALDVAVQATTTSDAGVGSAPSAPESSTTMYGVGLKGSNSSPAVSAYVVAPTDTQRVVSAFSDVGLSQITPSTVLSQSIPTALANKGNTDAQPTTVYGVAYDDQSSVLVMPAAIVPHSRVSFVQSAYSGLNITQVEPHTASVHQPTPVTQSVVVTTVYVDTVTVYATVGAPHMDKNMVDNELYQSQPAPSHNSSHPEPSGGHSHGTHPSTFSTMTVSKVSTPLGARDMHFQCDGDLGMKFLAALCDDTEIWLDGNYCNAHCGCTDAGVVQCDPRGEPEFINDCGGTDAVNGFCSSNRGAVRCYCTG